MNEISFRPDWVSHPGESIADLLKRREITTAEFAVKLGVPNAEAQNLLIGKLPINSELSAKLSKLFGTNKEFWVERQAKFDLALVAHPETEEPYLSRIPVREIDALGWLEAWQGTDSNRCLGFFAVTSNRELQREVLRLGGSATFRTSPTFSSTPEAVAVWLRQAEILAASIRCESWNEEAFINTLKLAKQICRRKSPQMFRPELENACAAAGVALVVLQAPKECKASGATIIQKNDQALLLLSHRHKTDDHFWFSFFHEAAHILLHRGHDLIVEHDDDQSQIEREANAFASEVLVPKSEWARLAKMRLTYMSVIREARTLGISPGMLVGQLQHKGLLPRNRLNKLKRKFEWAY